MPNKFKAFEDKINRIWWGKYAMWYNSSSRHSIKDSLLRLKGTHVPLWSASCQNIAEASSALQIISEISSRLR